MVELAASIIGGAALAALFGAMVFFPSVVAPTVFKVLDPEPAGRFLRAVFPGYYLFLIITSALAAAAYYAQLLFMLGLSLVALSTLGVRCWLVARITAWRDAGLAGDQAQDANLHWGTVSPSLSVLSRCWSSLRFWSLP